MDRHHVRVLAGGVSLLLLILFAFTIRVYAVRWSLPYVNH
ncbi:MAG: hypothetical protein AVDCRST_MAG93-3667, partial [uncultured Chloroflexia bacterium]